MKGFEWMLLISWLVIVVIMWIVVWRIKKNERRRARTMIEKMNVGTLRIDTSDSDGPYMFLELEVSVEEVISKKHVSLEVSTENYISRR